MLPHLVRKCFSLANDLRLCKPFYCLHLHYDHIWRIKRKSHLKITHPAQYRICTLPSFPPVGLIRPRMLVTHFYFLRKLFLFLIVLTFSHLYYDHMWSMKCKRHLKITHPAQYRICTLPSFPPAGLMRPRMLVTHFYYLRKLFLFVIVLTFSHLHYDHIWSIKRKSHLKITQRSYPPCELQLYCTNIWWFVHLSAVLYSLQLINLNWSL